MTTIIIIIIIEFILDLNTSLNVEEMDWIDLAQDRDRWRKLVNVMMNLRVP